MILHFESKIKLIFERIRILV